MEEDKPSEDTPSVELQKLDLEQRRLVQEKELKLAELKVQRKLKKMETQLQQQQFARGQWSGPFAAAVLAGIVGLVGTYVGSCQSRELERQKQESALILEAIKTPGSGDSKDKATAGNLVFFSDAGLISSIPKEKLKQLRDKAGPGSVPSLAPSSPVTAESAGLCDNFLGREREGAKLSIVDAPLETFGDLYDLVASLIPDAVMRSHRPPINSDSERVTEENRKVRVHAFLYAASREQDCDFHLIVGRAPNLEPIEYMTIEVSGLPQPRSPSYTTLKTARDDFKKFFGTNLPGATYDFYDPPIPLDIEGSLFFDMRRGVGPGPSRLRAHIPTFWEIHPVSKIIFPPP